ncbi:PREDICTED: sarcosine dehydrogenase, mitochondrial [Myotis davidii]|uniref:sarcosine dehydrogenase, mitochondrial n=1 Tax=Myotis davidii TaxID=225400 RepID=UPI00076787B8|nr:PREDICTED: sarcosine dehydrogenase, mitochondrial [Myotis davidii]
MAPGTQHPAHSTRYTAQSTWHTTHDTWHPAHGTQHTAGLLWQLRPSDVEVELLAHTRRVVSRDLEEETGLHTGWIQNGGLFIASNRQRLDEYKRLMSVGAPCRVGAGVGAPCPPWLTHGLCSAFQNMPNVRDHDASVYLRLQGDALSVGGYEPNPIFWEEVSDKFAFGLFDLDWDVFTQHIEGAVNRVPVLEKTGVKSTVCGPESFTPDHKPLMGEAPELRGFFLGCGFNSAGMMLGGGCGQELAHWIVHGRPEKDMYGYDIRRVHLTPAGRAGSSPAALGPGATTTHRHGCGRNTDPTSQGLEAPAQAPTHRLSQRLRSPLLSARVICAGSWVLCVCLCGTSPVPARPDLCGGGGRTGGTRTSRLLPQVLPYDYYGAYGHQVHQDHAYNRLLGAEYTFDFPPHHQQIRQECLACRGAAAVFDMSYFGKFYLVGVDARKAADWLFSADVSRPPGTRPGRVMFLSGFSSRQNSWHSSGHWHEVAPLGSSSTCSAPWPGLGPCPDPCALTTNPRPQGCGPPCIPPSPFLPHPHPFLTPIPCCPGSFDGSASLPGDAFYLAVGGAVAQHNWSHITSVLQDQRFRCQLIDSSEDLGMISIQGPASRAILQEVLDADLSNEAFPFSTHKLVRAAGHLVRAMRLSFVGELGWELHIPGPSCVPVYQAVMAAGAKHGLVNAGYRAIDSLSIEKVTVDEKVPMFGLEAIWRDGQVVGHVRRADFGFTIDKTLAYGYIRDPSGGPVSPDFVKSGDYSLERMGVAYPARAHLKSPFDPDNKRVKGIY